jgi:GntR family transcriptional regulator, transcriptional repressor for pyruvate dehydrogenase complex
MGSDSVSRDTAPWAAPDSVGHLVRAPKTAELIAGHLRGQIVRGDLLAGAALPPETTLMRQFGVSRPTLREAFRILETESLLAIRRGSRGGAQVTAPSPSVAARYFGLLLQLRGATIGDVYEARSAFEPACARLLAQRHSETDLAGLRAVIEELRGYLDSGVFSPVRWSVPTSRFHQLVIEGTSSRTLALQGVVLQEIVARHIASSINRSYDHDVTPPRFRLLIRSYTRLADLVQAGDGAGAEEHWRAHMEAAARSMAQGLASKAVIDLFRESDPAR